MTRIAPIWKACLYIQCAVLISLIHRYAIWHTKFKQGKILDVPHILTRMLLGTLDFRVLKSFFFGENAEEESDSINNMKRDKETLKNDIQQLLEVLLVLRP